MCQHRVRVQNLSPFACIDSGVIGYLDQLLCACKTLARSREDLSDTWVEADSITW
jgi:hypothetical protein